MTETKVYKLPENLDANAIGKEVENFLTKEKHLYTEGIKTPDGYFVQAKEKEESSWKKLAGMSLAIQVQILEADDTITVNIGNGEWRDKLGAGAVGLVLFAPLAVTAALGAYNQQQLPNEIFEHLEIFILNGGQNVIMDSYEANTDNENTVTCPNCKTTNEKNTETCTDCGTSLQATCPECGANVPHDTKFCTECGNPMTKPDKTCPECGNTITEDAKFCGECGTKIE